MRGRVPTMVVRRTGIGRTRPHRQVGRLVVALATIVAAGGCQLLVSEHADPGGPGSALRILSPVHRTQVADTPGGIVPVDVRVGAVDAGSLRVTVYGHDDLAHGTDITDELVPDVNGVTGTLTVSDLGTGFALLVAQATIDGDPIEVRSAFSNEPDLDVDDADRCETLGQSRCLLPFPSNDFTVADDSTDTGRRVDLHVDALPTNTSGTPIDPTEWNRQDGFSPGSALVLHIPDIDLVASGAAPITDLGASLEPASAVVLLDADTGELVPHFVELDAWATNDALRAVVIRPARNFREGHRIVVGVRHLIDTAGNPIPAAREFAVYRDEIPTYIPEVEARRDAMRDVLTHLTAAGVQRDELYLAWDFTVASERNLTERVLSMRDQAYAALGDGTPSFTVTSVQENVNASTQRRITGTFSVPLFLTGTGAPGSRISYGPDGLPQQNGTFAANFVCNVPKSVWNGAGSVTPGRGVVFGHGLLGTAADGNGFGAIANQHGFVSCATDWIGMSTADLGNVATILGDLSSFPSLPDRVQQGLVNFQFLARLMKDPNGFGTDPAFQGAGASVFRPGEVYFNGVSQGGIIGGAATAISKEWTRAALNVPGMNFSTLLTRSTHWDSFSPVLFQAYPDELDRTIGYSLIQMLWDRAEANGYAWHLTDDPLPGTPQHQVLLVEAFGDHQVANIATETEARTIGAHVYQPAISDGRTPDQTPFWDIPAVPNTAFTGSVLVLWDYGTPAPPTANLPPRSPQYGSDPHGKGGAEPRVAQQISDFLRVDGYFGDRCLGLPCTSNV